MYFLTNVSLKSPSRPIILAYYRNSSVMRKETLLLVDSDAAVRQQLLKYVKQFPYPYVIWECCNGIEAIRYINALQPDLVLMDINLPGKNAFEILDTVEFMPKTILMAVSTEYAARAFDYHVVHFMRKPLTAERVNIALQRFGQSAGASLGRTGPAVVQRYPSRILLEKGNRLTSIPVNKITHLKADRDYTWIYTLNGESYLSTTGIGQLERRFDPDHFIRIHRSYIVNIDYIQELYRDISKLFISLPNDVEINVGRNYLPAVKELIF